MLETLSNPDSQVPKSSKHRKTFRIRLLMLWKFFKRHRLKALFCTEWSPWKIGNVSLKAFEKSLNFLFRKKGTQTLESDMTIKADSLMHAVGTSYA